LTFTPVDPTGLITGGKVVLYLVNIDKLFQPVDQIIYIVTSADGLNFDMPRPIYVQSKTMVDPFVLDTQDGSFRLYTPSDKEGIISAVSSGGNEFIREKGVRMTFGGMPGALLLSNKHVRMFLSGGNDGLNGIFSMVSNDGLKFTTEKGVRIQANPGFFVDNPQPIQLVDAQGKLVPMKAGITFYQVIDPESTIKQSETSIEFLFSIPPLTVTPTPSPWGYLTPTRTPKKH
jgi:hypothetical protein